MQNSELQNILDLKDEALKQAQGHLQFVRDCKGVAVLDPVGLAETLKAIDLALKHPNPKGVQAMAAPSGKKVNEGHGVSGANASPSILDLHYKGHHLQGEQQVEGSFFWKIIGSEPFLSSSFKSLELALQAVDLYLQRPQGEDFPSRITELEAYGCKICLAVQRDGRELWAVRQQDQCLNTAHIWEVEPSPSSRDDAFLTRCRFTSLWLALEAAKISIDSEACEASR